MVGRTAREQLRIRKQALILESAIQRHVLATEWQAVRAATAWFGEAKRVGQQARAWWPLLAPVLGFLIARRLRRSKAGAGRMSMLWTLLETAASLWKHFAAAKSSEEHRE